MSKPGRNDLCHCGSGRKYKKCHGPKEGTTSQGRLLLIVVGGGIIAALAIALSQMTGSVGSTGTRTWDPAHGHYHDQFGREIP
ncbi:MAG: SEC-C metal-binding domain-containing protein [Vicinamibacterales bacterium]